MRYYLRLLLLLLAFPASAQTILLEQSMLTQGSFNSFTTVSVSGAQTWTFSPQYGAVCNGYAAGQSFANQDWLISPEMNLSDTDNVQLSFSHTRGNASVLEVGVAQGWYKVFATAGYTGNPATTDWIELSGFNQTVPVAWQYVSSGALSIPEAVRSGQSRIAFRYVSSATQSATWEIKNIRVTGQPQPNNPNAGLLKVTNWNTEWLGCTQFGPTDETQQINNVAAAMLAMNADIYCIQEVTNSVANPSLLQLLSALGQDQWDARLVPGTTNDCDQRQAIVFKKSKVQFVSAMQLSVGNASQGNSYFFNWSNGRFPAVYNVNFVAGNNLIPLTLVNLHAKAEDGNPESYARRLGASQALKAILDGATYDTKNVMVVGDFNDFLIGTNSNSCNCSVSPYQNFIDDAASYDGITKSLTDVEIPWENRPIIEHMIISNELFSAFVPGSAMQEWAVAQSIPGFDSTTSNHLPVSAVFMFDVLATPSFTAENRWLVYPNPARDILYFDGDGQPAAIFDLTGRNMDIPVSRNSADISALPNGIYLLSSGGRSARFVKQ